MIREALVGLWFLLCISDSVAAATYWVSPTGTSAWEACASLSDPGSSYCSLSTANARAQAGDVVYLKGGDYVLDAQGEVGISPVGSGTSANDMITFSAASGETPVLVGAGCYDCGWGIFLNHSNQYIKITGITGKNLGRWIMLIHYAKYNEIANCHFYSETGEDTVNAVFIGGWCNGGALLNCYSTHNWIHHNTFHTAHSSEGGTAECYEGRDLIRIGDPYSSSHPDNVTDMNTHNTVEYNIAYQAGHAVMDTYGSYSVVRGNIFHNEPWIPDVSGGNCNYPPMQPSGMYGHRVLALSEDFCRPRTYMLAEGNRLGWSSANPNNAGGQNLDLQSAGNIVRYNDLFAGQQSGLMFKYVSHTPVEVCEAGGGEYSTYKAHGGTGSTDNRVYNNTSYHNGWTYWWQMAPQDGCSTCPGSLSGFKFSSGTYYNVLKNNIAYDNYAFHISYFGVYQRDIVVDSGQNPANYPYIASGIINNWETANGDPEFTNPDLSNPSSTTLPNLTLLATSPAINGGTHLTQTNGSGANSKTVVVDDALYFQDGTWGSDLARAGLAADWIAIGTVDNPVQISSINYETNTITLVAERSWADDAKVWLSRKSDGAIVLVGSGPDYGAHEYTGACTPDCEGRVCGTDGCGGICGECGGNELCDNQGLCQCAHVMCEDVCCGSEQVCADEFCCTPDCLGRACGPDECGGMCGSGCNEGDVCNLWGACVPEACVQDCTGLECGPDRVCGLSCGDCPANERCSEDNTCKPAAAAAIGQGCACRMTGPSVLLMLMVLICLTRGTRRTRSAGT